MKENKKIRKNLPILIILFCMGIIFLFLSEYDSNKGSGSFRAEKEDEAYAENLETRLSEIISKIDGAGETKVMITLAGSSRYEYAEIEQKESALPDSYITTFLMQKDSDGKEEPVLIKTERPEILGVSIVCDGAENPHLRQKILELVAGTLNLNKNKIYVTN